MGDRSRGFEEAFDGLFDRAFRLAWRLLGDRDSAEDVAAEAMARAYSHWSKLEKEPWRDGWVLRVTTNLAIDQARRRPAPVPAPVSISPEDGTALRLTLIAALRALPRRQREVLALRYLSGMDEAEVAASLGISAGSVKTHIHRGLAHMREEAAGALRS